MQTAEYIQDYSVRFTFTDGSTRELDLLPYLQGPIFEPVVNPQTFRRFKVRFGSIVWPNGAGIAPETLHLGLGPTELTPYAPSQPIHKRRVRKLRSEPAWVVKKVRYLHDRVVEVTFADGLTKEIDIRPFIRGPIWEGWDTDERFRKVRVMDGSIGWTKGPDIAPETLYYDLGPVPRESDNKSR